MFAYCGNNPSGRFDPNGTGWLSALVSGVISATAALITGGNAWDVVTAGMTGFVGGYFGGSTYRLLSTGYSMISTWAHGGSFEAGLVNGAITYCASWVTGETILGESAGEVNQAIVDVGFSSGVTYTAAAIKAGITYTSREEKPSISQASEPTPNREHQTQSSGAGGSIVRYAYLY